MKRLTAEQIAQYQSEGFVSPVRVLSEEAALELRARLEHYERSQGGPLQGALRHKSHLLFTWLSDLVHNAGIVDTVEDLYGPDLLCWTTNFFIKEARTPSFVSWHQDSTYWGLSSPDVVTAWVALTDSVAQNGNVKYVPGSRAAQVPAQ